MDTKIGTAGPWRAGATGSANRFSVAGSAGLGTEATDIDPFSVAGILRKFRIGPEFSARAILSPSGDFVLSPSGDQVLSVT